MTGRPTYGVLPYADELWLDAEDSLSVVAHRVVGMPAPPRGDEWLRVAAVRLPRISNSTDVEALACEPGVLVRWVTDPAELAEVDLVVLPGTKATVADLSWLRERGLAGAIAAHCRRGQAGAGHLRGLSDVVPAHRGRGSNPGPGKSPGWGCWMPTSSSPRDKVLRRWRPAERIRNPSRAAHPVGRGQLVRCRRSAR